jgi:hypothetical protein
MEESDSDRDDEPPARATDVPYPLEGKYIDEADKRRIMGMSQLDREEILGQRAEEMSRANFTAELARRAANLQNDRKRKVDSEEPEESRRPKVKARVNDKLEEYKRNREQRGQQRDRDNDRHNDRRNNRRRSSSADRDGASDVDADGESDVEWDDRAPAKAREEVPAALRDFESVRVGRGFFSEVCFYPGFEDAVTGTFGRVGVGQDSQRRTMYKMAQIKGTSSEQVRRASLTPYHRHQHRQAVRLRGQGWRQDCDRPIRHCTARVDQEGLPIPVPLKPALRRARPRRLQSFSRRCQLESPHQVLPRAEIQRSQKPAQPPLDRARDQCPHRQEEAVRALAAPQFDRRASTHTDPV